MLHTESSKKGQDQFRQGVRIHLRVLDLNIFGDELLYFAAASSDEARTQGRVLTLDNYETHFFLCCNMPNVQICRWRIRPKNLSLATEEKRQAIFINGT
jgi:hypothetical protein